MELSFLKKSFGPLYSCSLIQRTEEGLILKRQKYPEFCEQLYLRHLAGGRVFCVQMTLI